MPKDGTWPNPDSMGGRIVLRLVDALDGKLGVLRNSTGTIVNLDVPGPAIELR